MKKCLLFFIVSLVFNILSAQEKFVDKYPRSLDFYEGGSLQFYKDLNDIFIKNKFKRCNNRESEMFVAKIEIVNDVAKINNNDVKDDCPTQLFINGLTEINKLKKWKSLPNSQNKFTIEFYPIDYFENFKNDYTPEGLAKEAEFPGGMDAFRNQLMNNIKKQNIKNVNLQIIIRFKINNEGVLNNIVIEKPRDLDEVVKRKIIDAVEQINTKWKPFIFRDTPVISSYRIPISL
ncbi:hypothetical protein [Chryseobacterium sp. GP-SGM7]|uniref:hypothetical protein n=1 Tax=Chryseobacterium sp. GP-SGM7 TaxID=3411323 RepID=UPI003B964496